MKWNGMCNWHVKSSALSYLIYKIYIFACMWVCVCSKNLSKSYLEMQTVYCDAIFVVSPLFMQKALMDNFKVQISS